MLKIVSFYLRRNNLLFIYKLGGYEGTGENNECDLVFNNGEINIE